MNRSINGLNGPGTRTGVGSLLLDVWSGADPFFTERTPATSGRSGHDSLALLALVAPERQGTVMSTMDLLFGRYVEATPPGRARIDPLSM